MESRSPSMTIMRGFSCLTSMMSRPTRRPSDKTLPGLENEATVHHSLPSVARDAVIGHKAHDHPLEQKPNDVCPLRVALDVHPGARQDLRALVLRQQATSRICHVSADVALHVVDEA